MSFELFKLKNAKYFPLWKYLIEDLLTDSADKRKIFSKEVDCAELDHDEDMNEARKQRYLKAEKQIKLTVVGNLSVELCQLVINEQRFTTMWSMLETHLVGSVTEASNIIVNG